MMAVYVHHGSDIRGVIILGTERTAFEIYKEFKQDRTREKITSEVRHCLAVERCRAGDAGRPMVHLFTVLPRTVAKKRTDGD